MAKSTPLRKASTAPRSAVKATGKKSSLAQIQAEMARILMVPLTAGENMRRTNADGRPMREMAATFIKPNDRLTSFDRLQIYNQQYWWRLLGCFSEDFRGLRAVLGDRKFDRLATAYLEECGSRSWSLRDLGQYVVSFLTEHPEYTTPHTELAIDMARVEWARVNAFDSTELPPLDPDRLAQTSADRLRIGLQPYLILLELNYPIDQINKQLREANVETASASNAVKADRRRDTRQVRAKREPQPIHLAVHRVEFTVYYKRLEPEAYRLLHALRAGATLADACETAFSGSTREPEENAASLREWFSMWMRFGWLTAAPKRR